MVDIPKAVKRRFRKARSKGQKLALAPKEPKLLIAQNSLLILRFVDETSEIIRGLLLPALEEAQRQDGVPTVIQKTVDLIELRIAELIDSNQVNKAAEQTANEIGAANTKQLKRLLKVEIDPEIQPFIDRFVKDSTLLIKSQSSGVVSQIRRIIDGKIGARHEDLASEIEHALGVRKSKARFIARDQVLKLNGKITQATQTSVGIVEYEWVTAGDDDVRDTHEELNGTIQRWDTPPVVSEDGRQEHPGGDYQCRCVALAIIPD